MRDWVQVNLSLDPGEPRFVPVPGAAAAGRKRNLAWSESPKRKSALQNMLALAPYFAEKRVYATDNAEALMGPERPQWRDYLPNVLAYVARKGFLNHTGRTVFEQMLVRLSSERNTLTYFDVSRGGMRKVDAADAKDAILKAASALQAHGVQAGDRVVLVGVNSTRYFIADAAVGLVGAVSVPLYYTSPVADVVDLSRESGAKLAFVGTAKMLDELPGQLDIPLVALLDGERRNAMAWEDFLASGADGPHELTPVSFDATATIRYTSGTTGKPKGVMFDQYQLRWMGEVMPALLDWRTRMGKLRYLSFLPMSHVVEGILVAYAPYYILSDIEMYYLNDFDALVDTLPKVRPTLFFSVPRFYEKMWNQFEASSVGQRHQAGYTRSPARRASVCRHRDRRFRQSSRHLAFSPLLLQRMVHAGDVRVHVGVRQRIRGWPVRRRFARILGAHHRRRAMLHGCASKGRGSFVRKAIVVGSGAGGCMAAKELAGRFEVIVLEAGSAFGPFRFKPESFEHARRAGLFLDERMIGLLFPEMRVVKARSGLVHVNGRCIGGTTTLATGNAVRCDDALQAIGIDLSPEFEELELEVPMTREHHRRWSDLTVCLFEAFEDLGYAPQVTPKFMNDASKCVVCGRCVLGCRYGAKWTADSLLDACPQVDVRSGCAVERVVVEEGEARGVVVRERGRGSHTLSADLVVLAAGGLNTPVILDASGIPTEPTLFVDPVVCVAAPWPDARLDAQLPMPFVSQRDGYILSPYFDWLSFFFNGKWRRPAHDIMSIMVKYADSEQGSFDGRRLDKPLTPHDQKTVERSVEEASRVLDLMGVPRNDMFLGTLNAGHPGGCLPLTASEARTFHHGELPLNLYVADASLLPRSMGNPPMLTIMALSKRVARSAADALA